MRALWMNLSQSKEVKRTKSVKKRTTHVVFSPAECEAAIRGVVPAKKRSHSRGNGALFAIAVFKFVKGVVFLALAFGALSFLHKDLASHVELWLDQLRIDPDNQFIGTLLSKLQMVHTKELKELSALGAGYAGLFLTEGTGLLFRKRWAEWLTIVATSSLMPLEVYELVKQFTAVRLLALLVNAAVVLYLIYLVRQKEDAPSS
jgi:uncharacterized membrane protein (DUF2068 family)